MDYIIHILIIISIFVPLALSLDLLVGRTGILSITHAGMYGLGAYTTAILTKTYGVSFLTSVAVGILVTVCASYMLSKVLSRLKGDYYTLGSFGANIILFSLFMNLTPLTGGPMGIFNIPQAVIFGIPVTSTLAFLLVSLVFMCLVIIFMQMITTSRFGLIIQAIRDDTLATEVFGYNVKDFKTVAFVISASIASIAGSLYSTYISFIDPSSFTLNESIFMLTMIIIGGFASKRGAIFGAVFVILLPELLRFVGLPDSIAAQLRVAIYGAILMYLMYKKPTGVFGNYTP
ncbi:MAG: branched-chain amino acid ABC transporter permease [Candidatus Pacebacteria bacterium]|nr:branched-chain amino acid ABC transporter permease [Candidatus Paceibacterota bacterium]